MIPQHGKRGPFTGSPFLFPGLAFDGLEDEQTMMAKGTVQQLVWGLGWLMCAASVQAQNPLIMDQFTADPTARVFDGKIYVYPSHDILPPPDARADWFCMADYHVFSSENLMDWTDHGVIVSQTNMPWVDAATYDGPEEHDRTLASPALPRQAKAVQANHPFHKNGLQIQN